MTPARPPEHRAWWLIAAIGVSVAAVWGLVGWLYWETQQP